MRCRGRGQGLKCELSALFAQEKDGGYRKLLMRKAEMSYRDTDKHLHGGQWGCMEDKIEKQLLYP